MVSFVMSFPFMMIFDTVPATQDAATNKWGLINIPGPQMSMGDFSNLVGISF